ncbi:MAG: ABC transporter permease [Candidatus Aminicenantales bacterium]
MKIAFRNALRQRRRTILTALTMFGGFVLAAISIGWSDGTYSYIINMFTRNRLGHIQIHARGYMDKPSLYKAIEDYENTGEKIQHLEGVETWAPRLYSAGLSSVEDKSAAVQVIGIDPEREQKATRFHKKIVKGKTFSSRPSHEAVLGKGLADVLHADPGDEVVVVSQAADGSIANDLYRIVGIIDSGDEASDRVALYLHLADAQELFALEGRIHEIVVVVERLSRVQDLTQKIRQELNNPLLDVSPWQEFARSFYAAMKADVQGMWIMLFVIILIVAVGVLNTVLMSVLERTREYGVLKAMGTKPGQIFWQVIVEVNLVALASIVIGIGISLFINHLLSIHGVSLPTSFTYGGVEFKTMYSQINARSLYIPALTVILSASLVSIFPALRAARIDPARAMRIH